MSTKGVNELRRAEHCRGRLDKKKTRVRLSISFRMKTIGNSVGILFIL